MSSFASLARIWKWPLLDYKILLRSLCINLLFFEDSNTLLESHNFQLRHFRFGLLAFNLF